MLNGEVSQQKSIDSPLMRENLLALLMLAYHGQLPPTADGRHLQTWAIKQLLGLGDRP